MVLSVAAGWGPGDSALEYYIIPTYSATLKAWLIGQTQLGSGKSWAILQCGIPV